MPLSTDRDTQQKGEHSFVRPIKGATKIFAGALVALTAAGYLTIGAAATTLKADGRAKKQVDNTGGADGDLTVEVEKGVFCWDNSAAGDAITIADIGNNAYIVDDHTVAKTDGTGTRSIAGKIVDVTTRGVWVEMK